MDTTDSTVTEKKKLGTFLGVFIPNVTMMFGVILFLRLGLVTANIGLPYMLAIIAISSILMLITCLSIGSITSSMDSIGSGGVYYLVSRTLGIEIGGALGLIIFLSQILSISLTINGFTFLLHSYFPELYIPMIEVALISILSIASIYSANIALNLQVIILILIIAAVGSILAGSITNIAPISASTQPFYYNLSFWHAFAIFYPAVTGIEMGMALSGTLKNPSRSILIGNIASLSFVAVIYVGLVIFLFYKIPLAHLAANSLILTEYAAIKNIVIIGISAAALSSALGSLIGAPRILQTMAQDGIIHKLLAKSYSHYDEPRYALLLTAIIATIVTAFSKLEQIIPILSMNCLITYALLNFISGINTFMNTASWRPTLKIHYLISFLGTSLAIILMFMINAGWSFISIGLLSIVFLILRKQAVTATFSDIRNSVIFFLSRYALYTLSSSKDSANTWHPILLVLAINPSKHILLAKLAHNITKTNGILIFGSLLPDDLAAPERISSTRIAIQKFLEKQRIKALVEVNFSSKIYKGFINFIKSYGIGSIQPNTIVLPIETKEDINDNLVEYLYTCYLNQKNILLFQDGIKFKKYISSKAVLNNENEIDLWWNSNAKESICLIISFVALFTATSAWKKAKINLKCIVTSENAVNNMQTYLEKFLLLSRLKMQVFVYTEKEDFNLYDAVEKYSTNSVITFLPLLPPPNLDKEQLAEDIDPKQQYMEYIAKFITNNNQYGARVLCCSLDQTEHKEIYCYPSHVNEVELKELEHKKAASIE